MTLIELRTYVASEVLDDRTVQVAGSDDSLWSDVTITRYLQRAQERMCKDGWVLEDEGNLTAGTITLIANQSVYDLHPSILRVLKVTPADTELPLVRAADRWVSPKAYCDGPLNFQNYVTNSTPGRPGAFSTDIGTLKLQVYPPPSAAYAGLVLNLRVSRMPLVSLNGADDDAVPEIPVDFHMDIADYAIGRCLVHPTADAEHKADGRAFLEAFDALVIKARQQREISEYAPPRMNFASSTANL
jgi:hypothetical protein